MKVVRIFVTYLLEKNGEREDEIKNCVPPEDASQSGKQSESQIGNQLKMIANFHLLFDGDFGQIKEFYRKEFRWITRRGGRFEDNTCAKLTQILIAGDKISGPN